MIFNEVTGVLLSDCFGYPSVSICVGSDNNGSNGLYQTLVSRGGTDLPSAEANDSRVISAERCVESADITAKPTRPP
jgi:hypothetical protein